MPDRDEIDRIKQQADYYALYSDLLGSDLRHTANGWHRATMALCPFHLDDRPGSVSVNCETGIFKCFSCGAGVDALAVIQEVEGCGFLDALDILRSYA